MPNHEQINILIAQLSQAMDLRDFESRSMHWENSKAMHEMRLSIQRDLGVDADRKPPQDQVRASLLHFHQTRELPNFNNLKYVCYGITIPMGKQDLRIIDDRLLFHTLLSEVKNRQTQAKQFRRCYQGLLESYFVLDQHRQSSRFTQVNWTELKDFFIQNFNCVLSGASKRGAAPEWLVVLGQHLNLFGDDPCGRYTAGFVREDTREFRTMCSVLGIPENSWIWSEALMAYVQSVCNGSDAFFKQRIPSLLALANGAFDIKLPVLYVTKAVAMVVSRYVKCEDKSEHRDLLNSCLEYIGNPWVKRIEWDSIVKNEPARKMVEGWLKRWLIKEFFRQLAEDGSANLRRLRYWLKWEPEITDMWFVLGDDAMNNRSAEFIELRKQMGDRARQLGDSNSANNAFIMKIGDLIVIEYGIHGNACYAFPSPVFGVNLERQFLKISELRQRTGAVRLIHRDTNASDWEVKFDYELRELLRNHPVANIKPILSMNLDHDDDCSLPDLSPTDKQFSLLPNSEKKITRKLSDSDFQSVKRLCKRFDLEWEDNRLSGGALWVLIQDGKRNLWVAAALEEMGFVYKKSHGFYFKES